MKQMVIKISAVEDDIREILSGPAGISGVIQYAKQRSEEASSC